MFRNAVTPLLTSAARSSMAKVKVTQPQAKVTSQMTSARALFTARSLFKAEEVAVTFQFQSGEKQKVKTKIGQNLLDVVVDNEIDIDGFGACEGTLACSTCHLIFEQKDFDLIPDEATDEELDMLDLAYGLTDTSRLGCQVCMSKDLDGIVVKVPEGINDQR